MLETMYGLDAWKERSTAFDRVRSIEQTVEHPRAAKYIEEEAAVSMTTADADLKPLAELNVVRTAGGATLYEPMPVYGRFKALRRPIDERVHEEIFGLKADLQRRIEEPETQHEVDSPTALREKDGDTETANESMDIIELASDRELSNYQPSVVEEVIERYGEFV